MPKECCGQLRDSRFCPECGEQLISTKPLAGLIKYLRSNAAGQQTRAQATRTAIDSIPENDLHNRQRLERRERKFIG